MSHKYDYLIDPSADSTANKVLRLIGRDRRVLELGTAGGVMTRALKAQGCQVTGVEYDEGLAAEAAPACERMLVADLETMDFESVFADQRFDVIVAADVLEHLRSPEVVLERMAAMLAPGGHLVISLPNVAYCGLVAALSLGRFRYAEKGLLDNTHLRFFTRESIAETLCRTGWLTVRWEANRVPVSQSEFADEWAAIPDDLRRMLAAHPDADIYQHVVLAVRADTPGLERAHREERAQLERHLAEYRERMLRLEQELQATRDVAEASGQAVAARDNELEVMRAALETAQQRHEAELGHQLHVQRTQFMPVLPSAQLGRPRRFLYRVLLALARRVGGLLKRG